MTQSYSGDVTADGTLQGEATVQYSYQYHGLSAWSMDAKEGSFKNWSWEMPPRENFWVCLCVDAKNY